MTYDKPIRDAVATYLRAVESHLANISADERAGIVHDVEGHIYEALDRRAGDEATAEDLRAVLEAMDPPESYAQAGDGGAMAGTRGMTKGKIALCISLGSVLAAGLIVLLAPRQLPYWIPSFLFLGGQLAAIVLGALDWANPFGKAAVIASSALIVVAALLVA